MRHERAIQDLQQQLSRAQEQQGQQQDPVRRHSADAELHEGPGKRDRRLALLSSSQQQIGRSTSPEVPRADSGRDAAPSSPAPKRRRGGLGHVGSEPGSKATSPARHLGRLAAATGAEGQRGGAGRVTRGMVSAGPEISIRAPVCSRAPFLWPPFLAAEGEGEGPGALLQHLLGAGHGAAARVGSSGGGGRAGRVRPRGAASRAQAGRTAAGEEPDQGRLPGGGRGQQARMPHPVQPRLPHRLPADLASERVQHLPHVPVSRHPSSWLCTRFFFSDNAPGREGRG